MTIPVFAFTFTLIFTTDYNLLDDDSCLSVWNDNLIKKRRLERVTSLHWFTAWHRLTLVSDSSNDIRKFLFVVRFHFPDFAPTCGLTRVCANISWDLTLRGSSQIMSPYIGPFGPLPISPKITFWNSYPYTPQIKLLWKSFEEWWVEEGGKAFMDNDVWVRFVKG